MKEIIRIPGLFESKIGHSLYAELCSIYPAGERARAWGCELATDDPRAKSILDRLTRAGLKPWGGFSEVQADEFWMEIDRRYDDLDFNTFSLLTPKPRAVFRGLAQEYPGPLRFDRPGMTSQEDIGTNVTMNLIAISDRVKRSLENAGFSHAVFNHLLADEDAGESAEDFRYWELSSDLILPPLSEPCCLVNRDGKPFDGDYDRGCFLKEDAYSYGELHYSSSTIEALGEFDLALTRERFGNNNSVAYPRLVVSHRVYRFASANQWQVDWVPVHVHKNE